MPLTWRVICTATSLSSELIWTRSSSRERGSEVGSEAALGPSLVMVESSRVQEEAVAAAAASAVLGFGEGLEDTCWRWAPEATGDCSTMSLWNRLTATGSQTWRDQQSGAKEGGGVHERGPLSGSNRGLSKGGWEETPQSTAAWMARWRGLGRHLGGSACKAAPLGLHETLLELLATRVLLLQMPSVVLELAPCGRQLLLGLKHLDAVLLEHHQPLLPVLLLQKAGARPCYCWAAAAEWASSRQELSVWTLGSSLLLTL